MNAVTTTQLWTLFRKDMRQLRALRRAGIVLHLVVLTILVLVSVVSDAEGRTFFGARAPELGEALGITAKLMLALGIWPLLALLSSIQAFAADRSQSAEPLLLSIPVPRGAVWCARATAGALSLGVMLVAGSAIWLLFATVLAELGVATSWTLVLDAAATSIVFQLIAFAAGASLVAFGLNPFVALLGGAGLAAGLFAVGKIIPLLFPLSSLFGLPLSVVTLGAPSAILIVSAAVMSCRGEPCGRGRILRGAVVVALGLLVGTSLFLVLAPTAVRAAVLDAKFPHFDAPPRGSTSLFVGEERGAFLLDVNTSRPLRYLAPSLSSWAWNRSGTKLAAVSYAGPFGTRAFRPELIFLDDRGNELAEPRALGDAWLDRMTWCGDHAVYLLAEDETPDLVVDDPTDGHEPRRVAELENWLASLFARGDSERCFMARVVADAPPEGVRPELSTLGLFEIHPESATVSEAPILVVPGSAFFAGRRVSPSARHWLHHRLTEEPERVLVEDIESGETWSPAEGARMSTFRWLAGDVLAWVTKDGGGRRTLWAARPGAETPARLGSWEAELVSLFPSPDRRHLRVIVTEPELGAEPESNDEWDRIGRERLLFRVANGALERVPNDAQMKGQWISSGAVATYEDGRIDIRSVEEPSDVRTILF